MFPDFISTKTLLLFPKSPLILLLFLQPPLFLSHLLEVPFPAGSKMRLFCLEIVIVQVLLSLGFWFFRPQLPVPPKKWPRSWDIKLKGSSGDHLIQHWNWSTAREQLWINKDLSCSCPHLIVPHLSLASVSWWVEGFPYFITEISSIVHFWLFHPTQGADQVVILLFLSIFMLWETGMFSLTSFLLKGKLTNSFLPGFPPRSQHCIKVHWQEKPRH